MQLIPTADGSPTVYSEKFDCTYHSKHGAIRESQHVFVQSGLEQFLAQYPQKEIRVFEMGFGTGLNAFLALLESEKKGITVEYTAVEQYPLTAPVFSELGYVDLLNAPEYADAFLAMHTSEWNGFCTISPQFTLRKLNTQLEHTEYDRNYHLVFFDAFDPVTQPELWTEDIFRKLYRAMEDKGILVTYSSKGQVRRNMIAAGFRVEKIQGPPGKREMLRAVKDVSLQA